MLDTAIGGFTNLALRAQIRDDDGIDQLHHFVTVTILAFFGAVTGFVEYWGNPINCWNYGDYLWQHYQDHVNKYCWANALYNYPNNTDRNIMPYEINDLGEAADPNLHLKSEEELGQVTFFRWVTIIFIVQAFLFKVPNLLWAEFNSSSGSNLVKMVEMLQGVLFAKPEDKKEILSQLALFLEQWLRIQRSQRGFLQQSVSPMLKRASCTLCVGNNTNYLSTRYLVVKAIFLGNTFFQFILLSAFLQMNFVEFGITTLQSYSEDDLFSASATGATSQTFPTVALCHFKTYDKLKAKGQWVQCILTINTFLEKLFLIEWLWLLLLLVVTSISFGIWCCKILKTQTAVKFVRGYMKLMGVYSKPLPVPESRSVEQFVLEYLRNDGVFILRILAVNTNKVVVADLVEELWRRYLEFDGISIQPMDLELATEAETPFLADQDGSQEEATAI